MHLVDPAGAEALPSLETATATTLLYVNVQAQEQAKKECIEIKKALSGLLSVVADVRKVLMRASPENNGPTSFDSNRRILLDSRIDYRSIT